MLLTLALSSLRRHRSRTILAVLGVAVSAAMLLDMVMLATGMRESFRSLLLSQGYQLRLAPKGTLPFDTDATIPGASAIIRRLRENADVVAVSPVLGGQLHITRGGGDSIRVLSAIALGTEADVQGDYELLEGRAPAAPDEVAVNDELLGAALATVGDTIEAAAGYDPQLRTLTGQRRMAIVGRARFRYLAEGERAIALPLATQQAIEGPGRTDNVSVLMVKARDGVDVETLRRWIEQTLPNVSVISTETAIEQVEQRLSYFRQLAFILGSVSLLVGFLLVTTLVTVSVNERLGEIAVLRAIGMARSRVVLQIVLEGIGTMVTGGTAGLALGLVTARYLNSILASFPGLPQTIDFFLFKPADAWTALALLALCGVLAGVYPAWRGASRPIARTLREDAIG
jgi:putative ABC transport system permease protein